MTYALEPKASRRRAFFGALAGAIAAVGPVLFGLILLLRTGLEVQKWVLFAVIFALAFLFVLRTALAYTRMLGEVAALRIMLTDDALEVKTRRRAHKIPRDAIESVVEFPGVLGGLRLELARKWDGTDRSPAYFDIPRGGENFGELRAAIERWRPVEAPRRRGRMMRMGVGIAIILGLFFVPFLMADLGKTPAIAAAVVVLGWLAMRFTLLRR